MSSVMKSRLPLPVARLAFPKVVRSLALLGLCLIVVGQPLDAQQTPRPSSLDIVPQSAAFYWSSMNHAAQWRTLQESNAYRQLMDCEVAKRMRKAYRSGRRSGFQQFGYGNPFADYLEGYAESIGSIPGKMLLNYLGEILGNEVFVYADEDWINLSQGVSDFYEQAALVMQDVELNNMDEATVRQLLDLGKQHLADTTIPHIVMGTVLDSPGSTKSLLQIAEAGLDELLTQFPDQLDYLVESYQVIERDDMYLLTIQLDAHMMPWEDVVDDPDLGPYLDDIKAIIANKSINLTLGVKGNFLLLALGPDGQHIENLGDGALLIDHPQLVALKQAAADHAITSVSYVSQALADYNRESLTGIIDSLVSMAKLGLQAADADVQQTLSGLTADLQSDADELKRDLAVALAQPGARLGFCYLFEQGIEGYIYNWGENKYLDDSRPLTILDQVGSQPALLFASRSKQEPGQFQMARKWMGRIYQRVTKYVPRTASSQREALMFVEISNGLADICSQLADATEQNLLPATENGQTALVLDFNSRNNQWHEMMPPSEFELPIPSVAVLAEHHDLTKIVATGQAYHLAVADLIELLKNYPEFEIPEDLQVPRASNRSAADGELFYFPLPEAWGLHASIAPHAVVTNDLLILGFSLNQTERLLSETGPQFTGILSERDRNLMAVSFYDHRQWIDALYRWGQYGLDLAQEQGASLSLDQDVPNDTLAFQQAELMEALDRVVALLKCLESWSSMSWMEDGAQVTRYQWRFSDVPARSPTSD